MIRGRRRVWSLCHRCIFPLTIALATISTYIRFKDLSYVQHNESVREVSKNFTSTVRMKNIVWYQLYHGGLRMDAKGVMMSQCVHQQQCQVSFIDNKMQEQQLLAGADALLLQGGRLTYNPPPQGHPRQVLIFTSIESPLHLHFFKKGREKPWLNMINWTMTYRTDSDILYKYGDIVPKPSATPISHKQNYSAIFHNKTKQVAWFVSDCKTESLREVFVKKLRQYINVDVYGQCGSLTCSKERGQDCLLDVARDYKFYLSFENSMCKDYMTEKVYSWFNMDLITVVRGARNYSALLPSDTYIDTNTFKTVKSLAQLLLKVGNDEHLYTKYLRQKAQYRTKSYKEQVQEAYCEICKRLHNLEDYQKSYSNIYKWWMTNSCIRNIKDLV